VNRVFTILVNYNNPADTLECLSSLQTVRIPSDVTMCVLIVNNGCAPECVITYDDVEVFSNLEIVIMNSSSNHGFAGGNNLGIRFALDRGVDYVWLLNNDTIVTETSLSELLNSMAENKDLGIAGSKIYYHSTKNGVWFENGKVNWWLGKADHSRAIRHRAPDYITGCSMLIRTEVFTRIGLLHESFFMYYEDVDFCIRARRAGWNLAVVDTSIVYHKVGGSGGGALSETTAYYGNRSRMIFINRPYFPLRKRITAFTFSVLTRLLMASMYLVKGNPRFARAVIRGLFHGMRDSRRLVQQNS
jgi:GT2 family glycosyltransferase